MYVCMYVCAVCVFGLVFVLNMHYMWFIEGQDLTTDVIEPLLFSARKVESGSWWIPGVRNSMVANLHDQRRMAPKPPVPKVCVTNFMLLLFTVGWIKFSRLFVCVFSPV